MHLSERGALLTRTLDDGRVIDLRPQIFNWQLTISENLAAEECFDEW